MKIIIQNCKCPSWNEFNRGVHWAVRAAKRDELQSLVLGCMREQYRAVSLKRIALEIKKPVDIRIEAHFKNTNRRDPDNLFVKPLIDGIVKAGIFTDDHGDVINSLTLMSKRKMPNDQIIICINE